MSKHWLVTAVPCGRLLQSLTSTLLPPFCSQGNRGSQRALNSSAAASCMQPHSRQAAG